MIDIDNYIASLTTFLQQRFGSRLIYVGLQGSYLRGEATPDSDIDIMVVIDKLSIPDLDYYRTTIQSLPHTNKSCGFICSKTDLSNWNPPEIFGLLHGTRDYYGNLQDLVPVYTRQDVLNFTKLSLNNLYHEICHKYIHASSGNTPETLSASYKSVFFILQHLYYLTSGTYIATKSALLPLLEGKHHTILARAIALKNGVPCSLDESYRLLFSWCQETLASINE